MSRLLAHLRGSATKENAAPAPEEEYVFEDQIDFVKEELMEGTLDMQAPVYSLLLTITAIHLAPSYIQFSISTVL